MSEKVHVECTIPGVTHLMKHKLEIRLTNLGRNVTSKELRAMIAELIDEGQAEEREKK